MRNCFIRCRFLPLRVLLIYKKKTFRENVDVLNCFKELKCFYLNFIHFLFMFFSFLPFLCPLFREGKNSPSNNERGRSIVARKNQLYDRSRVPFLAHWPSHGPSAKVSIIHFDVINYINASRNF